jgi:signal transduction histidine kinase
MVDNSKDPDYPQDDGGGKASASFQQRANVQEYNNRGRAVNDVLQKTQALNPQVASGPVWAEAGVARPAWIDGELFLLRRIERNSGGSVQGIWLDADRLKAILLAEARDLLPTALLVPALEPSDDGMVLASFPWRLVTPHAADGAAQMQSGVAVSLAVGWLAVLLAMLAGALLVRGVLRLSERRASFVSAVTHELRTPLTTFKLYTDLLENDVVRGEKRREYLHVLGREADRLTHLVENVLAFSRIERGSAKAAVRTATAAELLGPLRDRLEQHLADAGLSLRLDTGGEAARVPLRVDAAAVEHILFNLIDNAAKYAARSDPAEVSIAVKMSPRGVAIIVCDHGPGVSRAEQRRIFRAFHKSARDAAESRPGVGLGLALSRRLAREHGGELTYQPDTGGGCFVLSLRRDG